MPLIEDKLREIVMSEISMNYGEVFPTRKSIYEMEVSYLTATVQLMIRPSSKSHFLALLAYSCKEYAVEQQTSNYNLVKINLYGYIRSFVET